jgi:hypothetical protein
MRTPEQLSERYLRNLLRRYRFIASTAPKDNNGARGELAALSWALSLLASDDRVPLTETQRTTGVAADIAEAQAMVRRDYLDG